MVIELITQALRLVNLLIESVPIEQRQAQAKIWFLMWWPTAKLILKLGGTVGEAELKRIEEAVTGEPK